MFKKSIFAKITGVKNDDETETQTDQEETERSETQNAPQNQPPQDEWVASQIEGQLSVDVYQTEGEIVIKSAVAGVEPPDLDISISNDMITIRGTRVQDEHGEQVEYLYQECYWGPFSRSIILPQEVKAEDAVAEFKKGILTIRLPKTHETRTIKIKVAD